MIHIPYIFPLAGHSDRLSIFKSAAIYALSNEELEEILSCESEPVLKAFIHVRAACCLWKFVMPVDARAVFQNENMKQYARKYAEHGRKYAAICRKYTENMQNMEETMWQYAEYAEVISWHILHILHIAEYAEYAEYGQ
jgi:hypothetical protein